MSHIRTPNDNQATGRKGEGIARDFLIENGLNVIGNNIQTEYGEIDILAIEGKTYVFVEVKTRRTKEFGFPEQAVDGRKREHLINSALSYLQYLADPDVIWRIDVIAINLQNDGTSAIKWFKNAISS